MGNALQKSKAKIEQKNKLLPKKHECVVNDMMKLFLRIFHV